MGGFYIRRGEKIVGPVDKATLQQLVGENRLLPTDELSKEMAGPWAAAGSTALFAVPQSKTELVASPEPLPPAIMQEPPVAQPALAKAQHIAKVILSVVGRGFITTWNVTSGTIATRSQRKHELKLAKIHAKALADSRPASTPQPVIQQRASAPPPAVIFAPQVHQATVVKVVNRNQNSMYGCGGGCGTLLLLIIITVAIVLIVGGMQKP